MKKVSAITFHRAENFGSVLQTYALQEFVKTLWNNEVDYEIIDFNIKEQEYLYRIFKDNNSLSNIIKNGIATIHYLSLKHRKEKFNSFISSRLQLSKRYTSEESLYNNSPKADFYLCGSDQIWNIRAKDFSFAYLLNFTDGIKISYATSLGPLNINWDNYDKDTYRKYIEQFSYISLRESGSGDNISTLTSKFYDINVDPTLLLTDEQWREIESDANYKDGKYILLYCLEPTKEQLKMADEISKKLKLPIVILKYNNKNDIINHYVKRYDAGPRDFLAYIDNAALVLTSSFHGTVFSMIFHKSFYCFNGMDDNRISDLLRQTNLESLSLASVEDARKVSLVKNDYCIVDEVIINERLRSADYLRKAFSIE